MPPKTIIADEATNNLNTNTEDIGKSDVKKKKTIRKINSTDTMPRQLDVNWVIHKPSITKKRKDYMKNEVDDADGGVIENAIAPGKEKSVVDNENAKPKKKKINIDHVRLPAKSVVDSNKPLPTFTCSMCDVDPNTSCLYPIGKSVTRSQKKVCLTHLGLRLFYNYCEFEDCMKGAVVGHFCYKHRGGQYNPKIALRAANATHRETVDHGRTRIRKLKYCNFEGCKKLANQKGGWCRIHPNGVELFKQNNFCSEKDDDATECVLIGRERYCRVHGGHRVCFKEFCTGNGYFKGMCLLHAENRKERVYKKRCVEIPKASDAENRPTKKYLREVHEARNAPILGTSVTSSSSSSSSATLVIKAVRRSTMV